MALESKSLCLLTENFRIHAGEHEQANPILATPLKKLTGSIQRRHRLLARIKRMTKVLLKLHKGYSGNMVFIPFGVGQTEALAKILPAHRLLPISRKDRVGRRKGWTRVVDQST